MKREILVVEDQFGIRLLLTDALTNIGYRVAVAETGQEGLKKLCDKSFDLIILDYHLPLMNGCEILVQMKKKQIFVPVIMISGLIEGIQKDQLLDLMAIKWLAKPFTIQEVYNIAQDILRE